MKEYLYLLKKNKNQSKNAEYQASFLTVQSLRQVFLSRLQIKKDSREQPCLVREDAPNSLDFTLQNKHTVLMFNLIIPAPAAIKLFEGEK